MFDVLRVAGLATIALGAAGATGLNNPGPALAASAAMTAFEPLPPEPAAVPLSGPSLLPADIRERAQVELDSPPPVETLVETRVARAASLAELVRRHSATETPDRESECLAAATYFESKGEPLAGQLAVANVVINRSESRRFARTICGVVHQPGQFSFVRGGRMPPIARNSTHWRNAVAIAHIAREELWQPEVETALFFHAKRVSPGWRMQRVGAVGNHVFYR